MEKIRIRDAGWKKFRSGRDILDPQHWKTTSTLIPNRSIQQDLYWSIFRGIKLCCVKGGWGGLGEDPGPARAPPGDGGVLGAGWVRARSYRRPGRHRQDLHPAQPVVGGSQRPECQKLHLWWLKWLLRCSSLPSVQFCGFVIRTVPVNLCTDAKNEIFVVLSSHAPAKANAVEDYRSILL